MRTSRSNRARAPSSARAYRGTCRRSHRLSRSGSERAAVSGRLLAGVHDYPGTLADGSPPYRGPVLAADLTLPVGERLRLRGVAERDVRYASSLVAIDRLRYRNAFVSARYEGHALVDLPFRLVGLASAGYEDARYLLPYPYPDASRLADRRDDRYDAGL